MNAPDRDELPEPLIQTFPSYKRDWLDYAIAASIIAFGVLAVVVIFLS